MNKRGHLVILLFKNTERKLMKNETTDIVYSMFMVCVPFYVYGSIYFVRLSGVLDQIPCPELSNAALV